MISRSFVGWSWVGLAGSLTLHALLFAVVWAFTGLSFSHEAREEAMSIVRLVPGDRETAVAKPSGSPQARQAPAARPAPRLAISRPMAQRPVPSPVAPPAPAPAVSAVVPAPVPEPAGSEPAAAPPVAAATPVPVAPPEPSPLTSSEPAVEPPARPASEPKEALSVAAAAVEPGPEDARAVALDDSARRPEQVWLHEVTSEATVSARAHGEPFLGRREIFEFLLDDLEFASHVTRALRLARYRVWRTTSGLMLDDGWGSTLHLSLVQATNGARVLYARGQYRQPLLPDIHGQAVLMIEYDTTPADGGRDLVSAAVTSYVKVDSGFMALLMKLARSAVTDKAETEARRLVRTFARVSRAIEEDPARVFDQVRRSPDVPAAALEQFRRLLNVP